MKTDKSIDYYGFVSSEYEQIKKAIDIESLKRSGRNIDEDIFHDTIIKCVEKMKYSEVTKDQVLNYIFVSYIKNSIRETQYARNKYKDSNEITEELGGLCSDNFDYNDIIELLTQKFGEHDVQLFLDWCDGESVREIDERECTKTFRYKLDKIRSYAKTLLK